MTEPNAQKQTVLHGIPASPGIVVGPAFVYGDILDEVERVEMDAAEADAEIERFHQAVALVKDELTQDAERISRELGQDQADVFLVHSMILEDRMVTEEIERRIREEHVNAESAVADEMKRVSSVLASSSDAYLRDRAYDITDIGKRVIERMLGVWAHCPLVHPMIVVARELRASDTVSMDRGRILGFVTELGGKETHAAILARSLGVPAIVGIKHGLDRIQTGDTLVVDGDDGNIVVNPSDEELQRYRGLQEQEAKEWADLSPLIDKAPETADGERIGLFCNIGSVEDAREAVRLGADGVGLFRTEMLFMAANMFLTEEEQYGIYSDVVDTLDGRPVVIRTLDIGGDKFVGPENPYREHNPYLGYRSIRLLLDRPDLFVTQMRAILRAGVHGDVRILWPMISTVGELRAAKSRLDRAREELAAEGAQFSDDVALGVMIEIPSAAMVADRLARECDFLSIGTNDLVQYALAVDRGNAFVDHLYRPHDPAVLGLIRSAVEGARAAGKPIALCGEMGGIPEYVPLLIGLGVRELSVATIRLLFTKQAIRRTDTEEARRLAEQALDAPTASDVGRIIGLGHDGSGDAPQAGDAASAQTG
ncbi:MAG: phosphoenolpyruvate--protein phosphotransferase [Candidatus Eisenbacteria bacterium]|nr:phosphoenolpyruvate--protein phosphotransferase [Candidatus Eisenbacteria bacterium]